MYLDHFGLVAKPFQISADPRYLWLGEKHKEALAILKYGIFDNRGFLLLSGDVGTGKTTLINALLKNLGDETVVATVPDPGLSLMDFYNYISKGFGLDRHFDNKEAFLEAFKKFLIKNDSEKKRVLLIIDESQRLTSTLLEEIRLLSNIEKDYTKLLNIFFVGQNEFNDIILEQRNRPLRQRITINYNIEPLEEHEMAEYVQFRLSVAGCDRKLFDDDALREVYHYSEGYPRLINIICDHALLTTFVQGADTVTGEIVGECADELKIQSVTPKEAPASGAAAPVYSPQPIFIQSPPTAVNTVSPIHRIDYWMYGIILVLLMFIAAYLVFSAPMRIARMIGLDTISVESNAGMPPTSSRRPDSSTPSAGPIPQGQPPNGQEGASDLSGDSARAAATDTQATVQPTPESISEETLSESNSPGLVSSIPQTGSARDAATPSPAEGAVAAAVEIPTEPLKIYFQNNSNELTPEAYGIMEKTATILLENPYVSVIIRGYTDSSGNLSYNVKISEFRANIVKTYLVGKGLSDGRAATFGMGPVNAIADNGTIEGRQLNRRVEIEFIQ